MQSLDLASRESVICYSTSHPVGDFVKGTPWRASGDRGMLSLGLQDASSSCWAGKGMEGPPEGAHGDRHSSPEQRGWWLELRVPTQSRWKCPLEREGRTTSSSMSSPAPSSLSGRSTEASAVQLSCVRPVGWLLVLVQVNPKSL